MEKKIISFKGISNVPDDGLNEAGDMSVLLNMRHKGGELVPCQRPAEQPGMDGLKQAMYHANSEKWIYLNDNGELYEERGMQDDYFRVEGVESFTLMGNMVIINFADRVEYALWKKAQRKYVYLGGVPEMPKLKVQSLLSKTKEVVSSNRGEDPNEDNYNLKYQKGNIDQALATVYQEKGYVDRAWFRLGLRLFDGSYINIGEIHELSNFPNMGTKNNAGQVIQKIIGVQDLWRANGSEYYTELSYFVPSFTVYGVGSLGEWADLIASIDLFSTGSIMSSTTGYATTDDDPNGPPPGIEIYKYRTPEQMKDALMSAEFYKIAEFDPRGLGVPTWSVDNTSPSNLAVQDVLNRVITHNVIPDKSMPYNARLHAYEYKEKYFDGYSSPTSKYYNMTERENRWTVYVHIKTDEKNVIVRRVDNPKTDSSETTYKHLYYFSYPDSRAYKMEVFDGTKKLTLKLTPNPYKNEAVFVEIKETEVVFGGSIYYVPAISNLSWGTGEEPDVDNLESVKNILKVSAVDNPLYFPTAQTYKFEGDIVGLASNAEAISTGQFGQYPLFVFTDTGIWAMGVDTSGQGAYTTQSPFSREVCNGAICPVSGGVVFSTDKGVMVISGGQVADLSAALDGLVPTNGVKYSLIVDNEDWVIKHREGGNYTREYDGANLYISDKNYTGITPDGLQNGLEVIVRDTAAGQNFTATVRISKKYVFYSNELTGEIFKRASIENHEKFVPVPIREYINGAKLAYNYLHNEVILSNVNYEYSYVYSLDNQSWGMIDTKFDITTNSYPELVVYNNQERKRYTFDDTTTGVVPVVAITRPFTLGSLDYKRLRQAALRCTFDGQLNFYLLGSNDGANFVCITGKEVDADSLNNGTYRDLITAMSRSKQYKYFAIAIAGQMSGRISMAELLVDAGFAVNKLR